MYRWYGSIFLQILGDFHFWSKTVTGVGGVVLSPFFEGYFLADLENLWMYVHTPSDGGAGERNKRFAQKDDALWRMMPWKRGQKNTYAHRRYAPSKPTCVRGIPAKLDDGPIMVEMVELSRKSITKREKKVRQLSLVQACAQKSPCQPTCS